MQIEFKLLPNNRYHKDFFIKINKEEFLSDTYYFWADEFGSLINPYDGIYKRMIQYFDKWIIEIKNLSKNEELFIPIDFSDEYIGGLKVINLGNDILSVSYGFITQINDLVIQVKENGGIFTNLCNRSIEVSTSFEMHKSDFINSFNVNL